MQTKITIHECFSCHYYNHYFNVPYYVKGKKCKRCHKYNYFNLNTRHIWKKNRNNNGRRNPVIIPILQHRTNNNNIERIYNDFLPINNQLNQMLQQIRPRNWLDNNNINQNNHQSNVPPNNSESNTFNLINHNFNRINNNSISNTSTNIYNILDNNNNNHENMPMNFSESNNLNNYFNNNHEESNITHNNILNNIPKYPWLKREKCTNELINKYGKDSICSICLESFEINNNIHITACKHLFHYNCIEKAIASNIKDCPICRCNLRDGSKKQIINTNSLNLNHFLSNNDNNIPIFYYNNFGSDVIDNNNNNNYNIISHNTINRDRYASVSSYDNNNNNHSFFQSVCNFIRNLI